VIARTGCCCACFRRTCARNSAEKISVVDVRDITLNLRVLSFAALLTLVTSAIVGILPALSASRQDAIETIKSSGRGHTGVRRRARRASRRAAIDSAATSRNAASQSDASRTGRLARERR